MLTERKNAAQQVADKLFAAEHAIDLALTCAAELSASLPTARLDAKISAVVGQQALESAMETVAALVRARHQIVQTHHQLDEAKTQIGLRTVAIGGGMIKPTAPSGLRVVERAA